MNNQFETAQESNDNGETLRDLLDCEIILIGGGEVAVGYY